MVVPNTDTYHVFAFDYGVLQGLSLIPAPYILVWYPLFGIIKNRTRLEWAVVLSAELDLCINLLGGLMRRLRILL